MIRRYLWWSAFAVILVLIALVVAVPRLSQHGGGSAKIITGLKTPESVTVGPDRFYYVSNLGRPGARGDGFIARIAPQTGTVQEWATGLDDPKGIVFCADKLYVADVDKIWQVSPDGKAELFVKPEDFPLNPAFLNDTVCDRSDNLYVSDTRLGVIFKITPDGAVEIFADRARFPELRGPNGLVFSENGDLLVIDFNSGKLLQLNQDGASGQVLAEGFGGGDGLAFDANGNLYISDYRNGKIYRWTPDKKRAVIAQGLKSPADIFVDREGNKLLVPEFTGNQLRVIPLGR